MLIFSEQSIITMASGERDSATPASSPRTGHSSGAPGHYALNSPNQGIFNPSDSNPNATFDHKMTTNDGNATNDNSRSDNFMGSPDSVDTYSTESLPSFSLGELCRPYSPRRETSTKDSMNVFVTPSASLKSPPKDPPSSAFDTTQPFSHHSIIEKKAKRYADNLNFIITDNPKKIYLSISLHC